MSKAEPSEVAVDLGAVKARRAKVEALAEWSIKHNALPDGWEEALGRSADDVNPLVAEIERLRAVPALGLSLSIKDDPFAISELLSSQTAEREHWAKFKQAVVMVAKKHFGDEAVRCDDAQFPAFLDEQIAAWLRAVPPKDERLLELARTYTYHRHYDCVTFADRSEGHVGGREFYGFHTCPHPDCVLVRAVAEAPKDAE